MINEAYELLLVMEMNGFHLDLSVCNKILMGLCELNQGREAKRLFNIMIKKGAASKLASFTYLVNI
ncbi:Pentatricopeptide repeat [Parasponia andersonii]|uniref:Pentatricopeptide repeat n=1 Tax=Parasponia andersonii TaxID=3476 RepID=A0A2P5CZY6_PARAD|nr:Pentatricopeptide repeat [Parasponia andersonii]